MAAINSCSHGITYVKGGYEQEWTRNISQSETYYTDMLQMSPIAFEVLSNNIKHKRQVKEYTPATVEEQLITFLLILDQNFKNRVVGFLCGSGETINKYIHNILVIVITLENEYVKQSTDEGV